MGKVFEFIDIKLTADKSGGNGVMVAFGRANMKINDSTLTEFIKNFG